MSYILRMQGLRPTKFLSTIVYKWCAMEVSRANFGGVTQKISIKVKSSMSIIKNKCL